MSDLDCSKSLTLGTSYNVTEQDPGDAVSFIEWQLDDAAIAWTLRLTDINSNTTEIDVAAGTGTYFLDPPARSALQSGWTWNAKSASGTPALRINIIRG